MDDAILDYYERELTFVRHMGEEFARRYPKIAGRLQLEPGKCEDPHVERLIEAFALLCGRIRKKIDDGLPEVTEALLNILYPHYLNPVPSLTVVKFNLQKGGAPEGYRIEQGTQLHSRPVGGLRCRFRTCYPVTLWPIEVAWAGLCEPQHPAPEARQALVIRLKTRDGIAFDALECDELRFFLNGPALHVFHLYELLFNNVSRVECQWLDPSGKKAQGTLAPRHIRPVGFAAEESVLPYPQRSFPGYILLFEYFCFPEKFLFFDVEGLRPLFSRAGQDTVELWFYLDRNPKAPLTVGAETFSLFATPAVNLFSRVAEPVLVEQHKSEYLVIPDLRWLQGNEVLTVDGVAASEAAPSAPPLEFIPLYSLRHGSEQGEGAVRRAYWHTQRRPSERSGDAGTDLFISFTDWGLNPAEPGVDALTVHATCCNRDLPGQLPFGGGGDFELELAAPVESIDCLVKPTPTRRPPLAQSHREGGGNRNPLAWRLISHLSLNFLSLVEGGEDALREILKIYDLEDSAATRQQIAGIVSVRGEHVTRRVGQAFCRGVEVTLVLDEEKFVGAGHYLFACVLEHFLGQYVSLNSFSQLVATTMQKKEVLKRWPPRSGNRVLL